MSSLKWKRRIANVYPLLTSANCSRKLILIYHAVGTGPWAVSADAFKKQIQWLKKNCDIVSLNQLVTDTPSKKKTKVALTFDDGYACLYDIALPVLREANIAATVYLTTGWIDAKSRKTSCSALGHYPNEQFLTWDEVKILDKAKWEIGSHGVEHIDLTKQSSEIITKEIVNSKEDIERRLEKKCNHFAYTFGKHSKLMRNAVNAANYHYAVAAHHQLISKNSDKMALPRMNIDASYSFLDFQNIIQGRWDFMGSIHRVKKMVCL